MHGSQHVGFLRSVMPAPLLCELSSAYRKSVVAISGVEPKYKIRPLTTKKIFDYEYKTPYIIHNTFIGD